jgi:tRNA (cmo5U34)-methyltransferase
MANNSDGRFHGVIGGRDYGLVRLALTYYDDLEACIGLTVREHAARLTDKQSITVVDLGCGTGLTTREIMKSDSRTRVTAIDNESFMLETATEDLRDHGGRINFVESDLITFLLEQPSESIDIIVSGFCIHNLEPAYRARLFQEIGRVLVKGGLFVNGDKSVRNDPEEHAEDYRATIASFDVYDGIGRADFKAAYIVHYIEDERVRFTQAEQEEHLTTAGFTGIHVVRRFSMDCVMAATKA